MSKMTMSTTTRLDRVGPFRNYWSAARKRAEVEVAASAERINNLIAALAPFDMTESDDFHMVEHIQVKLDRSGLGYEAGFSEREFADYGQPPYFIYTEFGTTKMDAQPCVFPARDLERPVFLTRMREAMRPRAGDTG